MDIQEAIDIFNQEYRRHIREDRPECDAELNDACRLIVNAYLKKFGKVWVGNINVYKEPVMWELSEELRNFEANFIVPTFDQELFDLIVNRHNAKYEGTKKDSQLIDCIFNKIENLNGTLFIWS